MHPRSLACLLVVFACVSFGAACATGGEPSSAFIEVLQTVPEDDQTEVSVETRIGFRIDGDIDPSSLSSETFFMADESGTVIPSTVMIADEADTAELIPDEPLSVLTRYIVTVTTDLRARDERMLEEPYDWEFSTLDSEWGTSEWLEEIGVGSSDQQQIAVDAQSNAIAVWEYTEDTGGSGIWANRYTRVDLWGEPERISTGPECTTPQIAVDDAGNGFAVWAQRDASVDANIWAGIYVVGEGWGESELLQAGEVTPARTPSIGVDSQGNAIAIWSQRDAEVAVNERVWARRFEPLSGWGPAASIDDETTEGLTGTRTSIGVDGAGNAVAVWARGPFELWSNRYTAGSGWGTAELINPGNATEVREQRLAVGAGGDAFVVWVQTQGTRDDIWAVRFSGSQWGTPVRLDTQDAGNKNEPDIAVDGSGVAHAVWAQSDSDFDNIWAAQYAPGSEWAPPQLVEPPNPEVAEDGDAITPRIATNDAGNTFVVWRQISEDWGSVWSNRIDPGMPWAPQNAELIEDIRRAAKAPGIVVDDDRHAHAVWVHYVSANSDWVRTNRFE